ncbi:MAG: hypothetical protein ACM3IL_04180 [Deltaproteobacteria bacterium]
MADNTKMRNAILIVLIIISLAVAGGIFMLFQQERVKNVELQGQLEDVKAKQRVAETRLEESKKMISDMEGKLQTAQTKIDSLSGDLQKEKDAKQEAIAQIDQLKTDLANQKDLRVSIEKKLTQAQDDIKKIQTQLKDLNAQKVNLEEKLQSFSKEEAPKSSGVELGKIVVNPETGQEMPAEEQQGSAGTGEAAASGTEGKILVVNKDYNFAVINMGNKDGVGIGNIFSVYHNGRYIGDIKVEKVHDSMSAAGFLSTDVKDKVSEGDRVELKAK